MKTIQLVLNTLLLSNHVYNPLQSISERDVQIRSSPVQLNPFEWSGIKAELFSFYACNLADNLSKQKGTSKSNGKLVEGIYPRAVSLSLVLLTFKYVPSHPTASDFYRDDLRCELHMEKYNWLLAVMINYKSDSVLVHHFE